jgi:hypothetical protein
MNIGVPINIELQRDGEEEQGIELSGVPDDALAGGGAEQRQQDEAVVRVAQEAVGQGRLRALTLGLHLGEDRRFVQLEPDVDREHQQDQRDQERNAPAPIGEGLGVHLGAAERDDRERQEEAQGRGGLDPARGVAATVARRVFGHVSGRPAVFAAQRQALDQAQPDHQHRRQPANRGKGRQQADQEGRPAHEQDGHQEGIFAANQIAQATEHQGAERTDQKARGVGRESRQQRRRLVARRKEQRREEWRQGGVEIEVVPLEHGAERRCEDDSPFLSLRDDAAVTDRCCHSHEVSPRNTMGSQTTAPSCRRCNLSGPLRAIRPTSKV